MTSDNSKTKVTVAEQPDEPWMMYGKLEAFIIDIQCLRQALKIDEKNEQILVVFKKGLTKTLAQAIKKNRQKMTMLTEWITATQA